MKIIDIFEVKTVNQLNVLKYIYDNNGMINIKMLSELTLLDSKTVSGLLEDILVYIEEEETLDKMEHYQAIRIRLIESTWVYDLCEKILLGKEVSIVSFISKHYISESKLRRKIKSINDLLKEKNIKIISRNRFLSISGPESQIRFLIHQFYWTIFKGIKWPFREIEFSKIWEFFHQVVFTDLNVQVKDVTYVEWSYFFSICLIRNNQGNVIIQRELPKFTNNYYSYFHSSKLDIIDNYLSEKYLLSREERLYLFLVFQTKPQFYLNDLSCQSLKAHKENKTECFFVYQAFMNYLEERIIHPEQKKYASAIILSANMSAIMSPGFYRPASGYGMDFYFQATAPQLLPNMERVVEQIAEKYPKISFLKEKKYLAIRYAEAYSLVCNMLDFEDKIHVGVITDVTTSLEELIVRKLNYVFYLVDNVEFMTINKKERDYFDFVIKTSITIKDMSKKGEKILIVDPNLPRTDITRIADKIKEIRESKKIE